MVFTCVFAINSSTLQGLLSGRKQSGVLPISSRTESIRESRMSFTCKIGKKCNHTDIFHNIARVFHTSGTVQNRNKMQLYTAKSGLFNWSHNQCPCKHRVNRRVSSPRNNLPHMTKSSFMKIVRYDIEQHPYKIKKWHGVLP